MTDDEHTGQPTSAAVENLSAAVDELKRFAELVSQLALQPCEAPELKELRLEALSDLCLAARQLADDDDTFRALFDMALLHASNRLYQHRPAPAANDVITVPSRARGDIGANV
ncbi:hypothetical protein [Bradyrhizobium sp. 2TAF24]|uniref:hypothetical protein n=1 Tax=Bradyrhizobium sp. 2TAF24 TaxID=3233011 RepID=UPI003F8F75F8